MTRARLPGRPVVADTSSAAPTIGAPSGVARRPVIERVRPYDTTPALRRGLPRLVSHESRRANCVAPAPFGTPRLRTSISTGDENVRLPATSIKATCISCRPFVRLGGVEGHRALDRQRTWNSREIWSRAGFRLGMGGLLAERLTVYDKRHGCESSASIQGRERDRPFSIDCGSGVKQASPGLLLELRRELVRKADSRRPDRRARGTRRSALNRGTAMGDEDQPGGAHLRTLIAIRDCQGRRSVAQPRAPRQHDAELLDVVTRAVIECGIAIEPKVSASG